MPRFLLLVAMAAFATAPGAGAASAQVHQHDTDHHQHSTVPTLENPVPADALSLAEGRQIYEHECAACHGASGKGDGKMAATLIPRPSDLTDEAWKHGATESEIFTLVRDGAKQSAMRGYGGKLNTRELWSIVNYLRSIGPKPSPFH